MQLSAASIGTTSYGSRLAYAFRLIPREKREGLLNGVLWLDIETDVALWESGYLAKNPSIFVKRINLTRENDIQDRKVAARITHVAVETRLVGPAQLVIIERPCTDERTAQELTAVTCTLVSPTLRLTAAPPRRPRSKACIRGR